MNDKRAQRNLLLMIFYEGPWEKLYGFCYGMRRDFTLRWEMPDKPKGPWKLLQALATYFEYRDAIWRYKYNWRRKNPPALWKRRSHGNDAEA